MPAGCRGEFDVARAQGGVTMAERKLTAYLASEQSLDANISAMKYRRLNYHSSRVLASGNEFDNAAKYVIRNAEKKDKCGAQFLAEEPA